MATPPTPPPARHGILIVHGIGNQRQSDILLDVGEPLFDWLARWYAARSDASWTQLAARNASRRWGRRAVPSPDDAPPGTVPDLKRVVLNFDPVDRGEAKRHSHAVIALPDRREWVLVEAWWAASLRRQPFGEMLVWTSRHLFTAARSLVHNAWERLINEGQDRAPLNPVVRWSLAIYYQITLILYTLALVVGFVPLMLILLLAQVPFSPLRSALYNLVGAFLEVNLGEFRSIFEDEVQSANMRRRVAGAVMALVDEGKCAEVTIVAHSGGAVVCFDMLTDRHHSEAAGHVRKLITVGSGLNKAWQIAPELRRLHGPLRDTHWVDIWGTLDPAPTGPVQPPPDPAARGKNLAVFDPGDRVIAEQHLAKDTAASKVAPGQTRRQENEIYWPASVRCTNELSLITDHWVYWRNDEQALSRIIAEIDQPYYRDSPFWRGDIPIGDPQSEEFSTDAERPLREAIQRRKLRVVALGWARLLVMAGWLALAARWAADLGLWLSDRRASVLPLPGSVVGLLGWGDAQAGRAIDWLLDRSQPLPFGLAPWSAVGVLVGIAVICIVALVIADAILGAWRKAHPGAARRWRAFAMVAFTAASAALLLAPLLTLFLPRLAAHPLFWIVAALVLGLLALMGLGIVRLLWSAWDKRARDAAIAAIARNGLPVVGGQSSLVSALNPASPTTDPSPISSTAPDASAAMPISNQKTGP